jgi:hypothetical protein
MANLEPRRGRYVSRRQREQRAYTLVVVGGGAGLIGAVGLVLAIAGVMGAGIPIALLLVAVACYFLFRRSVGAR